MARNACFRVLSRARDEEMNMAEVAVKRRRLRLADDPALAMTDPRPSAARRGYGESWRRFRRYFLTQYPQCAHCDRAANEVDHIQTLRDGGAKYDLENLQALCKSCHSRKTQAEMNGRSPRLGCDVNGVPVG